MHKIFIIKNHIRCKLQSQLLVKHVSLVVGIYGDILTRLIVCMDMLAILAPSLQISIQVFFRNIDDIVGIAACKCLLAQFGRHGVAHIEPPYTALLECPCTYMANGVGQGDGGKVRTASERLIAYLGDGCRKLYAAQVGGTAEHGWIYLAQFECIPTLELIEGINLRIVLQLFEVAVVRLVGIAILVVKLHLKPMRYLILVSLEYFQFIAAENLLYLFVL